jgi:hypothetical protein
MEIKSRINYRIFQILTVVLLSGGFALAKLWIGAVILLLILPYWWFSQRLNRKILSGVMLVIFGGIAAFGLLSNASSYLMIGGMTTALACWELEDHIRESSKSSISYDTRLNEKIHQKILCLAFFIGLIVAEAGLLIKFTLPFGIVFLIAIVVLFCIFQLFLLFKSIQSDSSDQ